MSFEVVASSRLEERKTAPWQQVINTGLQTGGTGVALAMVGILSMFNNRPIIVGLLTLGYATLGLLFLTAGILIGVKRPFATLGQTLVGGAVAGLLAGVMEAVLAPGVRLVRRGERWGGEEGR